MTNSQSLQQSFLQLCENLTVFCGLLRSTAKDKAKFAIVCLVNIATRLKTAFVTIATKLKETFEECKEAWNDTEEEYVLMTNFNEMSNLNGNVIKLHQDLQNHNVSYKPYHKKEINNNIKKKKTFRQTILTYFTVILCTTFFTTFLLHGSVYNPHEVSEFGMHVNSIHKRSIEVEPNAETQFIAPNDLLRMTALGVKTYNRPHCLKELIASVRLYAPYLPIFVIDDSDDDVRAIMHGEDEGDVYVQLPTDSGTGYGRNKIVEAIDKAGYMYLIMADDDFKLVSAETFPTMAKYMLETNADVVAATRCDHNMNNCQRSKGLMILDQQNQTLTVLPNITSYPSYPNAPTCYRSDLVQQFFMAKTEKLLKVRWDDNLKNNDHYDFLLSAKLNNLKLITCSDIQIFHEKSCEALSPHGESYKEVRERRWYKLLGYIMYKWNLKKIHDEVGKALTLDDKGVGTSVMSTVDKYSRTANETVFFAHKVIDALNSDVAAWTWMRPVFDKHTWVVKKTVNPCTHLVSGSLHCEYDRYSTFKNVQSILKFSMYLYNETCHFAESLWRLQAYGKVNPKAHVYYVTVIADDNAYLKRLFQILNSDRDRQFTSLVVVLMDSDSKKIVEDNARTVSFEIIVVNQGPPFSRSIGLKVGFQVAQNLALKRNQHDAIGFSIDTSIMIPDDFSSRIRTNTICGISAFVPVVFKCMSCLDGDLNNHTDGYWVTTGFGMAGLCFADYISIGGWSTVWGYKWGGEDVDIMERINKYMPYVVRTKEPGYIYVRNPSVKKKNPAYYTNKNLYPRPLPPSSLTTFSDDSSIKRRVMNYIKSSVPVLQSEDLVVKTLTKTYNQNAAGLTYQALVQHRNDPETVLWFFIHSHLSPVL